MEQEIMAIIEGLLFIVGDEGVGLETIAMQLGISLARAREAIDNLQDKYENDLTSGLTIIYVANHFKLATKPKHKDVYQKMAMSLNSFSLSNAALEVLAIIAYNQPITKTEIEAIRGVNSDATVNRLVSRALLKEAGKAETPGRPLLYMVTDEFMDYFKLASLDELPNLDINDKEPEEEINLFNTKYKDEIEV